MRTLQDDSYERTEKAKRSKIYRNMLDEQVRSKRSDRNRERSVGSPINQYSNMHLPPIEEKLRRNEPNKNYTPLHETSEDDLRTEAYLNNCEDIIRNLKELKERRRRKSTIPLNSEMSPMNHESLHVDGQLESPQIERLYYPKPTYFSPPRHQSQVESRGTRELMRNRDKRKSEKDKKEERKKPKEQMQARRKTEPEDQIQQIQQELPKPKKRTTKKSKRSSLAHSRVKERNPQQYLESPVTINQGMTSPIQETPESDRPRGIVNIEKVRNKFTPNRNALDRNYDYFQKKSKEPGMEVRKTEKSDQIKEVLKSLKDLTELMRAKTPAQSRVEIATNIPEEKQEIQQSKQQIHASMRRVQEQMKRVQDERCREQEQKLKKAILAKLKHANRSGNSLLQKIQLFRKNHTTTQSIKQVNGPERTLAYNEQLMAHLREMIREKDAQSYEVVSCLRELTHYLKQQNEKIDEVSVIVNEASGNSQNLKQSRSRKLQSNCFELSSVEQEGANLEQNQSVLPLKNEGSEVIDRRKQQFLQKAVLARLKKAKTRGTIFMEKMEKFKKSKESNMESRIKSIPNRQTYDPQTDREVSSMQNPEESSMMPPKESGIQPPLSEPAELDPKLATISSPVPPSNESIPVAGDQSKAPV